MCQSYINAVESNLEGLTAVSSGICPGCETCREEYAADATMEEFEELWQSGEVNSEPSFSWQGCDICGSSLGGDVEPWHAVDENNEIVHGDRCCVDCVLYLANGDIPENWGE